MSKELDKIDLIHKVLSNKDEAISKFPSATEEISKLHKRPKCGICKRNVIQAIDALENKNELLSEFMGEEVQLTPLLPMPQKPQQPNAQQPQVNINREAIVEQVKREDWPSWFNDFVTDMKGPAPLFNTFYTPENDTITVSYVKVSRG